MKKPNTIDAKTRAEIIAYEGTHKEAAIACGVPVSTAGKIRRKAGVVARVWGRFSDEVTEKILELHAKKWSHAAIGKAVGRSTHSITGKLGSLGATAPRKPAVIRPDIAAAIAKSNAYFAKIDGKKP